MNDLRDELPGTRTNVVSIPTIWIAVALSLIIHVAVLWEWLPRLRLPSPDELKAGESSLVVRLAPPPSPPPAPAAIPALPQAQSTPAPKPRPPAAAPRPRVASPPVLARKAPVPDAPQPPPAVSVPPPRAAAEGDLASYVEARRRARAEVAPDATAAASAASAASAPPAAEDENARANRIAAANLASQRPLSFGYDPARGGGIFTIQRMGYDNAEFIFYGWNRNMERNTAQLIEVRRGGNSDIRIAVVRRMIAIIREHEQDDFVWESKRLGRNLTLSARARDNAGLEEFMMREFFEDPRQPWR